jgi:4-amino-4-deoxy-L-arabinose transferase-like glycosyltransferase
MDSSISPASVAFRLRVGLIALAVLVHLPLWIWYAPMPAADGATYLQVAEHLRTLDFTGYLAKRPPGYPVLLLLSGENDVVLWAIQSALGIATVLLIYELALKRGLRPAWSFAAGAATLLSLNLLLFESAMLTETLTTFLLALALWLWFGGMPENENARTSGSLWIAGAAIGAAALVKPFLQYAVPLLPLLTALGVWRRTGSLRKAGVAASAVALPALLLVLGWSAFNKAQVGYFGITTLAGYNLTQHSGAVMEDAPDEYATVRDIYLKYREPRKQRTGSHSMTIWEAYPEMMEATGQSFVELSRTLGSLSVQLLRTHPKVYARNAFDGWVKFWKAPLSPAFLEHDLASPALLTALQFVWQFERFALVAAKAAFLFWCAFVVQRIAKTGRVANLLDITIIGMVLAGSALQALTEYGENARYSIPFQPLILLALVIGLADWQSRHPRPSRVQG